MSTQVPDWQPAVIDGQPEILVNRAAVEALLRESPLGETEARRRMNELMRDEIASGRIEAF